MCGAMDALVGRKDGLTVLKICPAHIVSIAVRESWRRDDGEQTYSDGDLGTIDHFNSASKVSLIL